MYSKIYNKSYLHEIYKNQMIFCEKKNINVTSIKVERPAMGKVLQNNK